MSIRVRVTSPRLAQQADAAMKRAALGVFSLLDAEFARVMGRKMWAWPRQTPRYGGARGGKPREIAGSPRNIVDTGVLRASWSRSSLGPYGAQWEWAVAYATAIHEGAVLNNGGVIEPRPWTDVVLGKSQIGVAGGYKPPDIGVQTAELFARYFKF